MKFSKTADRSAMENCCQFISAVSPQIPVREMPVATGPESDSQVVQMEDSQVVSPDSQQQVSRGTKRDAGNSSTASAAASGLTLPNLAQKAAQGQVCVGFYRGLVQLWTFIPGRLGTSLAACRDSNKHGGRVTRMVNANSSRGNDQILSFAP